MDLAGIGLFDLAERRLAWTDQRQALLAQNIANADTPGWRSRDLRSFAETLNAVPPVRLAMTAPGHLDGTLDTDTIEASATDAVMVSPDGNAVSMETELTKIADTATTQASVTAIYKKYMAMFALALGHGTG